METLACRGVDFSSNHHLVNTSQDINAIFVALIQNALNDPNLKYQFELPLLVMDNFQKYSRLMLLIAGGFFGFIIFIALLIFILRLFSITMFHIPGFDLFFQYVIIIIPYILFFAAYYYLYKKISLSKNKLSRVIARVLILTGCLICFFTLTLSTAIFLHVNNDSLRFFEDNGQYALIIQLLIIFLTAGVLAGGDGKEKDWMERNV